MLLIKCPWCGTREQLEFFGEGEAHITRPAHPNSLLDEAWGNYLFFRSNPKGVHYERWIHVHGCRRWFYAARNTVTDEILATYPPRASKPSLGRRGE